MSGSSENPSRLEAISTRWTLLRQAHAGSVGATGEARGALVLRYLPAVRRYVRAMVGKEQDAEDLTQDVVVRLMSGDFGGADPGRGRFRDLLKVAIRNMVRNYWARSRRRRPVDLDVGRLEGAAEDPAADPWLASWRHSVLDLVWKALEQEERQRSGSVTYSVLRLRAAHPDETSEQLASRLSQKVGRTMRADAVRQQLRRARLRFADLLIEEVAGGMSDPTPERIEDELIALGLLEPIRALLPPGWGTGGRS